MSVWFIGVGYQNADAIENFVSQFHSRTENVHVTLVENSAMSFDDSISTAGWLELRRFEDNPGYYGAASRAIAEHPDRLRSVSAVVICNLDLQFDPDIVEEAVDRHSRFRPDRKWILAPQVFEDGYRFAGNPLRLKRPEPFRQPLAVRLSASFPTFVALSVVSGMRRRWLTNPATAQATGNPIYMPHGCFIVFGSGYFTAGGTIPELPLTYEEYAVAEIAHLLRCPIILDNKLLVRHERGVTTRGFSWQGLIGRFRLFHASTAFYRNWNPAIALNRASSTD